MMSRKKCGFVVVLGLGLAMAETLAREEHSVGTKGIVLELDSEFERKVVDPTLGNDQFRVKRGRDLVYCALVESDFVVEGEVVHRRMVEGVVDALSKLGEGMEVELPFTYHGEGDVETSCMATAMRENGLAFYRETRVVSWGGSGIVMFFWGGTNARKSVHRVGEDVVAAVRFPDPKTESGRAFVPVPFVVETLGYRVSLSTAPSVLAGIEAPVAGRLDLESPSDDLSVHGMPVEDADWRSALRLVLSAIGRPETEAVPDPIREAPIDGRFARSIVIPLPNDPNQFVDCTLVELEPGKFFDLRIIFAGPIDALANTRRNLIESIRIAPLPRLDLSLSSKDDARKAAAFAAAREVFARSKLVAPVLGAVSDAAIAADGSLVLSTTTGAQRMRAGFDGFDPLFVGRGERRGRFACGFGGGIWTIDPAGSVIVEGATSKPAPAEFVSCVEGVGGEVIGVRGAEFPNRIEGLGLGEAAAGEVVRVAPDGVTRTVARLPEGNLGDIALDPTRRHLFVSMSIPREEGGRNVARLLSVDLETGESKSIGEWRHVGELASSDRGVLVTGQQQGGRIGIHRANTDGSVVLVMGGGEFFGFAERDGRLAFGTFFALDGEPAADFYVRTIASDEVSPFAVAATAPSIDELVAIGTAALAGMAPWEAGIFDSRDALDAFLVRAESAAAASGLPPLPRNCEEVDEIFRVGTNSREVADSATVLVVALAIRAMCDSGGTRVEFVPASKSFVAREKSRRDLYPSGTVAAFGCNVEELVLSNFDTDGTSWIDIVSLPKFAESKRLFVGIDSAELTRAVADATPDDYFAKLDALVASSTDPARFDALAVELLEAGVSPAWRNRVYDRIARAGDATGLERLVRKLVESLRERDEIDEHALLRAALHGVEVGEVPPSLVAEARAAVEAHPDSIRLWIVLGEVYRRSPLEHASYLARLAFDEARARDDESEWTTQIDAAVASLRE